MDIQEIENGHHLYRLQFRITDKHALAVEIIFQEGDQDYVDCQIIYRHIHMLKDYHKRQEALDAINELNEMKTGYYSLYLAMDGEIFLKTLLRVGPDIIPMYETLVYGSSIGKNLVADLGKRLGDSGQ